MHAINLELTQMCSNMNIRAIMNLFLRVEIIIKKTLTPSLGWQIDSIHNIQVTFVGSKVLLYLKSQRYDESI